jgi:NhaD family Na+/H+ antiporter
MITLKPLFALLSLLSICTPALASSGMADTGLLDLTRSGTGIAALLIFCLAYLMVMSEEFTHLRKSKPVILAAGVIWGMIAWTYRGHDDSGLVEAALRHNVLDFAELFLFLLSAMTYVNTMDERLVFESLRTYLVRRGFGYRQLFWLTGFLAFFLSPVLDNLTTALVMCAVLIAVGKDNERFVGVGCVNIVIAANAGGAFSPFGDITTLMVWQAGLVQFNTFFLLFVPALVNFVVPAAIMHFAIPAGAPRPVSETVRMRRGARRIIILFACTVATAVGFHNFLHLPPFLGMMTGLAYLQFLSYYLKKTPGRNHNHSTAIENAGDIAMSDASESGFDFFNRLARSEWDTLLFFYGVVLCVGGLGTIGYLSLASQALYIDMGPTTANVAVGILSAVVDNIPVMFAVLNMHPDMVLGHWLLITLTAGVGGSLLSIGSAAGVALMGQARGKYTFFGHLKWTPAILAGYAASILVHLWINADTFSLPAH